MTSRQELSDHTDIRRFLRILVILDASERVGACPVSAMSVHTIAYFADALSPVWDLPVIDGQILKRVLPYYPTLQKDLDRLVGIGLVQVRSADTAAATWPFVASYALNRSLAQRVLDTASGLSTTRREVEFVEEVVFAASGLGLEDLPRVPPVDATYGDPIADVGSVLDVDPDRGLNPTSSAALRFRDITPGGHEMSAAELINLYVRHLSTRLDLG